MAFSSEVRSLMDDAQSLLDEAGEDELNRDEVSGYMRGLRAAARVFASVAASDNGRFDRGRFERACGF